MQFGEVDVFKAPERTRTEFAIILGHGRPDAMPSRHLFKFQGEGDVLDVPSTFRRVGPLVGGVLQLDHARMGDRQANVNLTTRGIEEREEYAVRLELLRDATVDRVVAIDPDLIKGTIREVESDGGMCGGASDKDKDFANDLIRIDADRVPAEGAWLLP